MKRNSLIFVFVILIFSNTTFAQQSYSAAGRNFKRNVAAVMFSTIGGAVLGLSTLSFYGKPQEHTDNITTGALLGLLAGSSYLVYDSYRAQPAAQDYSRSFIDSEKTNRTTHKSNAILVSYQWDF